MFRKKAKCRQMLIVLDEIYIEKFEDKVNGHREIYGLYKKIRNGAILGNIILSCFIKKEG